MKNKKKTFLYIFFTLIIIASGVVFYLDTQKKEEEPDIYKPLPSEIIVDEKDKHEVQVESALLNLAPDANFAHEREYYNNNDIIGRLEIPNLFNILVTKTTDNEYYLYNSIEKKKDIRGTEFLDFRVTPTSKQVNIYGHNTRDVKIQVSFLKLEKFLDKTFFDQNPYVVFQYEGGKSFYKILAMKEVYETNTEHLYVNYTGQAFVDHVNRMTSGEGLINKRDVPFDENSEILVLQTCSHHWDKALYTLIAVKI